MSAAMLDAAPTDTMTGIAALSAFCTSSNPARPLTTRIRSRSGTSALSTKCPITLSTRVVAADVLADAERGAVEREEPGGVNATGRLEELLSFTQPIGQRLEQRGRAGSGLDRRQVLVEILDLLLAAHPAGRGGAEFALDGLDTGASRTVAEPYVDPVTGEAGHPDLRPAVIGAGLFSIRRDLSPARDDTLGEEKAGRQLRVVARCAHGDDQRLAIDADLERFLDHDEVLFELLPAPAHRDRADTGRLKLRHG